MSWYSVYAFVCNVMLRSFNKRPDGNTGDKDTLAQRVVLRSCYWSVVGFLLL